MVEKTRRNPIPPRGRIEIVEMSQPREVSFKIKEILAKYNGDVKKAEREIAFYHEELRRA